MCSLKCGDTVFIVRLAGFGNFFIVVRGFIDNLTGSGEFIVVVYYVFINMCFLFYGVNLLCEINDTLKYVVFMSLKDIS